MKRPKVTIITVNYDSRPDIEKTIRTLKHYICNDQIRFFVVDNSDDKQLAELIETKYPEVQYFRSPGNIGYGRGCNIGLEQVETPYCLLLNPDALLQMADLERMLSFIEKHANVACLGPCVHDPDGSFQSAGGLPTPYDIIKDATGFGVPYPSRREIHPGNPPFKTDWLCASIILVRMKAIDAVGHFDPRFFLYFEETDLCRRFLDAGWEIWATGEAEGFHQNAVSALSTKQIMYASCIAKDYFQSRFYYMTKHHGWTRAIIADVIEYALAPARWIYQCLKRKDDCEKHAVRLRSPLLSLPERKVK